MLYIRINRFSRKNRKEIQTMEMFKFDESFVGWDPTLEKHTVIRQQIKGKDGRLPTQAEIDHWKKLVGG